MEAAKHPSGAAAASRPAGMEATAIAHKRERVAQEGKSKKPTHYPFWFGGSASSMGACVTHPLDLVKVRLQMRSGDMPRTMSGTFVHIVKHSGVRGLYNGLSASLLRQLTYSTTRFGLYEELKARLSTPSALPGRAPRPPSFPILVAASVASGFAGGIVGNAADVLNVRMQHDAALPMSERRNYRHAIDGLVRMTRDEGFRSWFRGVWPNSLRAAAMSAGQLASYDAFKTLLMRVTPMGDTVSTHFSASFLASLVAATVTSPIDVIKTRVMSATGTSSITKLLTDIYAAEGLKWMFKGWLPSFLRLGPQTICTFLFLESHRKVYRKIQDL